ncbi:hypothetical protein Gohar_024359 [Gossypium harknessii]|uniref:Uncharacterized protein n=1 Tax=Gossypium harknessii TaxID=34285 RepID=A0A7J9HIA6_9ROSI|nr:hypothetical protein [Gossypium harknessii]
MTYGNPPSTKFLKLVPLTS